MRKNAVRGVWEQHLSMQVDGTCIIFQKVDIYVKVSAA